MSANTLTVGYPVHVVAAYRRTTNPHCVQFTDYRTVCGIEDTTTSGFGRAGTARRLELCLDCFPTRDVKAYFPEPEPLS
jgi:hypothetical protein